MKLTLQNLVYLLPFYHEMVVMKDDADIQLEFNSCICQVMSLLTTLEVAFRQALKSDRAFDPIIIKPLLVISLGFCHVGSEFEKLYVDEDKNAFISAFTETI
jgi:hypothetical protein